ncbi:hypothetical protein M1P56_09840 [Streptomyces sp. HU2014]|uniref:hypothetical protein n=1 Tax=Streptomyces sp. HU2014 TaxID=2939414 RepID=UPI00200F73E9|nr:hypothetical protein [Streptomyces sp. HU2014]UQI44627.1 hypothetical protein M1P56_09840 [Streptomyces sp. HU2014]
MAERFLFGGSAADVAEDVDGGRIAGAPITIWDGPADTATRVMDLVDVGNGAQIEQSTLIADEYGYVPPFLGPPGAERLWAKAGSVPKRVELMQMSLSSRFSRHTSTDADPHKDREYTDRKVAETVKRTGKNDVATLPSEAWLNVEAAAGTNDVVRVNRSGEAGTQLKSNGTLYIQPFTNNTGLVLLTKNTADTTNAITVQGGADGTTSVFRVRKSGAVLVAGTIQSDGEVIAPNVGSARVFSGPASNLPPVAQLKPGDVWVQYG